MARYPYSELEKDSELEYSQETGLREFKSQTSLFGIPNKNKRRERNARREAKLARQMEADKAFADEMHRKLAEKAAEAKRRADKRKAAVEKVVAEKRAVERKHEELIKFTPPQDVEIVEESASSVKAAIQATKDIEEQKKRDDKLAEIQAQLAQKLAEEEARRIRAELEYQDEYDLMMLLINL